MFKARPLFHPKTGQKQDKGTLLDRENALHHIKKSGVENRFFGDFYHRLLTMKWPFFFAFLAGFYVIVNVLFGALYALIPHGVSNVPPYHFIECFFFSVQTLSTVGYGAAAPIGYLANTLVTVETFVGIICTALVTGLVFARFSRPHARVLSFR